MLDLSSLRLAPGDVRHERVNVPMEPLELGGQTYSVTPDPLVAEVDVQAASGGIYLKLAFSAHVEGPCFRCLEPAGVSADVHVSEYHSTDPSEQDDELVSDYIEGDILDVQRWVRDSLVFALPDKILDREDCAGLCPHCGERLEPGEAHDCQGEQVDTRWEKLRDLL
ncbi:MAG TPA: YceD family protein [Gaiellales bacterium]|nr:YceD family protein [Gaiellales bacterium]